MSKIFNKAKNGTQNQEKKKSFAQMLCNLL